jgi:hypothetical protein
MPINIRRRINLEDAYRKKLDKILSVGEVGINTKSNPFSEGNLGGLGSWK